MTQSLVHVSLIVRDYDEAIEFFTQKLGFSVAEDSFIPEQNKRWVVISPPRPCGASPSGTNLLLARASSPSQERAVGNQTGGRVAFFLQTDDFERDYTAMLAKGVRFRCEPRNETYGMVAVFEDLYGNLWDLLGPARNSQPAEALTITSKPP